MGQNKLIQKIICQRGLSHKANGYYPCIVSVDPKAKSKADNLSSTHLRTKKIFKPANIYSHIVM